MGDKILQRVVMPPKPELSRLYYRETSSSATPTFQPRNRTELILPPRCALRTNTWFNSFFESYWREFTPLGKLSLRLRYVGRGILRLYRSSATGLDQLLDEVELRGSEQEICVEVPSAPREQGRGGEFLSCEIVTHASSLHLVSAEWIAPDIASRSVSLVVGYCTFNRSSSLIRNLRTILQDTDVREVLDGVIVVDQGDLKIRAHADFGDLERVAGEQLRIIEQKNCGGSGGFTRFLLEAQDHSRATHVLLMDDDAMVEPESILRTAAFFSLAKKELAVGGHMLDSHRTCELIQPGTRFRAEQIRIDEPVRWPMDRHDDVAAFAAIRPVQYNGWWFLAFPVKVLDRVGLPLPLFLRGDDLEFGCRLAHMGVPTVALPGIAVWHEAIEAKGRGHHAFYEFRNYLIVSATHFRPLGALRVARTFLSRLLDELLAYDYHESGLLCEALQAYLRGPSSLCSPKIFPYAGSGNVEDKRVAHTQALDCEREECSIADSSDSLRYARLRRYWFCLRNIVRPSPSATEVPKRRIHGPGEQWYQVASSDVVLVETADLSNSRVLRRSREQFLRLLFWGFWLALRVLVAHCKAARDWCKAAPHYRTRQFWQGYLGLPRRNMVTDKANARPSRKQSA